MTFILNSLSSSLQPNYYPNCHNCVHLLSSNIKEDVFIEFLTTEDFDDLNDFDGFDYF